MKNAVPDGWHIPRMLKNFPHQDQNEYEKI